MYIQSEKTRPTKPALIQRWCCTSVRKGLGNQPPTRLKSANQRHVRPTMRFNDSYIPASVLAWSSGGCVSTRSRSALQKFLDSRRINGKTACLRRVLRNVARVSKRRQIAGRIPRVKVVETSGYQGHVNRRYNIKCWASKTSDVGKKKERQKTSSSVQYTV